MHRINLNFSRILPLKRDQARVSSISRWKGHRYNLSCIKMRHLDQFWKSLPCFGGFFYPGIQLCSPDFGSEGSYSRPSARTNSPTSWQLKIIALAHANPPGSITHTRARNESVFLGFCRALMHRRLMHAFITHDVLDKYPHHIEQWKRRSVRWKPSQMHGNIGYLLCTNLSKWISMHII